ncbi:MAG: NifB/NifX family molybdenum-iron cluster-binding protein [Deltaproteobacteria bacterium]|nr:NifB/NifX family molybdenum-iron cluster-binding protein [Deltaproteobacteria bacterium]MBW1795298.1 NifB/NifX family molybdenum-iron cluster-binding protein [Deltaproteobacteria bacterium]MBW2330288.1 NifB/NifX family molybdenum-iron cluster-binding protein [Deltaproteobacteria bacterium]
MKVAVTSKGKTLDAEVEPRFSRSPFFVIVNTETGDFKAFENPGASAKDAASVKAVKFLIDKGAKAIITGNLGHNAFVIIQDTPLRVYLCGGGTIREAIADFKKRKLLRAKKPSVGFKEGLKKIVW